MEYPLIEVKGILELLEELAKEPDIKERYDYRN